MVMSKEDRIRRNEKWQREREEKKRNVWFWIFAAVLVMWVACGKAKAVSWSGPA